MAGECWRWVGEGAGAGTTEKVPLRGQEGGVTNPTWGGYVGRSYTEARGMAEVSEG